MACSKLQVPKIRYNYQINKFKYQFPNVWHAQNPQIFKRWKLFRHNFRHIIKSLEKRSRL